MKKPTVAVLLPCFNEEITIAQVVHKFREIVPEATVYVYDNNSTDRTAKVAAEAGAIVRKELRQGKGYVIRRMFADIEADLYIIADGDGTYAAEAVLTMLNLLTEENLDMVVAVREGGGREAYRAGHRLGNRLFNWLLSILFNSEFVDIFSGYRVFSRRFVKSFPANSRGFDIETELSVYCLEMGIPVKEIFAPYGSRPEGSNSKLQTYRHGLLILWRMLILYKEIRPFQFFGYFALICFLLSLFIGYPLITTYLVTGLVPRFPSAILAASLGILGFIGLTCGLVLDSLSRGRREAKRMHYLRVGMENARMV